MSLAIASCAGHVHVLKQDGAGSGFYNITSPSLPVVSGAKIILQGIPLSFQEIVQPSVTLDDKKTIYVFGSAWASATVEGLILMGDNSNSMNAVNELLRWYDSARISKRLNDGPVMLSIGDQGYPAYLVGATLGAADPRLNSQAFSLPLIISKD